MTDEGRRVPGDFESWCESLVRAFPEFSETNDDDFFRDDDGLVLGHLFVGEITAHLVAGRLGGRHRVRALLDFLEAGYATGDAYRQNVIALSFVENLGPRSRLRRRLRLSVARDCILCRLGRTGATTNAISRGAAGAWRRRAG